jgi:hypothetical protein
VTELTEDDIDSLTEAELAEMHADEERHDVAIEREGWMRTSIDSIPWPTAITIRPVEVNLVALAMARMAMDT